MARFHEVAADVWVVTEGKLGLLPDNGFLIDAGGDWGYGEQRQQRKVLAWSRHRWRDVHLIDESAARGRLVVATTDLKDGPVRVIAVCIPWREAHVLSGRRDAARWEEHLEFCNQLSRLRQVLDARVPTVIAGDFNQRIPRARQPTFVMMALEEALDGMKVWTAGETRHGQLIDHIAGDARFTLDHREAWPATVADRRLSDHSGVACDVHMQ
jgi:endonuclease/exonuclease/phosphatase family metal-dependent hydrolase